MSFKNLNNLLTVSFILLNIVVGIIGTGYLVMINSPRIYLPSTMFLLGILGYLIAKSKYGQHVFKQSNILLKRDDIIPKILLIIANGLLLISILFIDKDSYTIHNAWYLCMISGILLSMLSIQYSGNVLIRIYGIMILITYGIYVSYEFLFLYPTIGNDTAFHTSAIKYIIQQGTFSSEYLGKYKHYPALHLVESIFSIVLDTNIRMSHWIWGAIQYVVEVISITLLSSAILRLLNQEHSYTILSGVPSTLLIFSPFLLQARFWYYISTYLGVLIFFVISIWANWIVQNRLFKTKYLLSLVFISLLSTIVHPLIVVYVLILVVIIASGYLIFHLNKEHNKKNIEELKSTAGIVALIFIVTIIKITYSSWDLYNVTFALRKLLFNEPTQLITILSTSASFKEYFLWDAFNLILIFSSGLSIIVLLTSQKNFPLSTMFLVIIMFAEIMLIFPFGIASLLSSTIGARFLPFQELILLPFISIILNQLYRKHGIIRTVCTVLIIVFIISGIFSPIYGLGRYQYEDRDALIWSEIYPLKFTRKNINLNDVYGNPKYFGLYFYFPDMTSWQFSHIFNPYITKKYRFIIFREYDKLSGIPIYNFRYGDVYQIIRIDDKLVGKLAIEYNVIYSTNSTKLYRG